MFTKYYGIGKSTSDKLEQRWKQTSLSPEEFLYEIYDELPIATQVDLKYKPNKAFNRKIIEQLDKSLKRKCDDDYVIAGSYRRGKEILRDIDIVVTNNAVIDKLPLICTYAKGDNKISAILKFRKHIIKADIFIATPENVSSVLLYATGSKNLNIRMRAVAKKKGYLLNQYGVYTQDKKHKFYTPTEQSIFDLLGITYLEPLERSE